MWWDAGGGLLSMRDATGAPPRTPGYWGQNEWQVLE